LYTNFVKNFEVSIFRNFDFDFNVEIGISIWFRLVTFDKSKFRRNSILISSKFWFQFWFWRRNSDSDFYFGIGISIFQHRNSDFGTRFQYNCRNFKAFFTKISQEFYFDCLSEFRFRLSQSNSKLRLLSIISSEVEINFLRNSGRNSDEINFVGNPKVCGSGNFRDDYMRGEWHGQQPLIWCHVTVGWDNKTKWGGYLSAKE
jgi:hypothetical protein